MSFVHLPSADDQDLPSQKGRPTTCKYCGHEFHKKDLIKWETEKHPCPSCRKIWCDKPETERMLMILQDDYLKYRDKDKNPIKAQKVLTEITKIFYSYTASIIKINFSNMIQEPGNLERYTQWAVSKLIEEYLKRPDFKVNGSFKGMLFPKIQEAIWGKQEHACAEDSLDYEYDDGHVVVYEDDKKSYMESLQERHSKEQLVNSLCELIFGVSEYCTEEENWIRLLNFRNYIIGGEKYTDKFFELYEDKTGKLKFLETLDIVKQELHKSDMENH